jgi:hydroxymethylglutaryl-CoA synthase
MCDLEDSRRSLDDEERNGAASFEAQVAPSLLLPSRIGNTYTAALYLGLASLLHAQGSELANQRIGMFSYGSGCSSEFFTATVGENAAAIMARAEIDALLRDRIRVSIDEYERIMNLPYDAPLPAEASGTFRFVGVTDHMRCYA